MNETNVRKWAKSLRQFSRDSSSQSYFGENEIDYPLIRMNTENSECSATLNDELDGLSDAGTYIVDDEDIDEKTSISSFKQSVLRHDTFEIQGFLSSISHSTHVPHVNSIDTSSDKKPSIKPPESFVISPTSRRRTNPPMPKSKPMSTSTPKTSMSSHSNNQINRTVLLRRERAQTKLAQTTPKKEDLSKTRVLSHRTNSSDEKRADTLRDNGQRLTIQLIQNSSKILEKFKPNNSQNVDELEHLVNQLQLINQKLISIDQSLTSNTN